MFVFVFVFVCVDGVAAWGYVVFEFVFAECDDVWCGVE